MNAPANSRILPARPPAVWLLVVAVVLLAANLRVAVGVIGPLLPQLRESLALTGAEAGLLTALPTFCFGLLGAAGPTLARKLGPSRTVVAALTIMTLGQLLRALIPGDLMLFVGSALALASIAVANVIMPSLVRLYFPGRVAAMTAVYTVLLSGMSAIVTVVALPLESALGGGWQIGLGAWAAVSAIALLPGIAVSFRDVRPSAGPTLGTLHLRQLARIPKAWVLAAFFGTQSLQAYVVFGWFPTILGDDGYSQTTAAAYVGLLSLAATVISMFIPYLLQRLGRPAILIIALTVSYLLGYTGLLLAPLSMTWLWCILVGFGTASFPMALFIVTLRAKSTEGVLALSGFMQSTGYIFAGTGVFLFGAVHGSSTSWSGALIGLCVLSVLQLGAALYSARSWTIEDELDQRSAALG